MQKLKDFLTDYKWLVAITASIYAICVHIYTLEGLPKRVSKLEAWQSEAQQYHHSSELVLMEIRTSIKNMEVQLEYLRRWTLNERTQL